MANTTLTKQGTSLAETSQEELQRLSTKAGMVPRSPAGAVGIGASPDAAKMAGTPAQKASRIDGPAAPGGTLDQANRLTPPSAQAVTAPEKLDRMKQLGSLNTQVEGLVQGYMQQLQTQQAALGVNATALEMAPAAQRPALQAALEEYKGALTEQQKEAALIKAGQALGRPLSAAEIQSYYSGAPEQLGMLAKAVTPDSVKLSDLQLSSAGVNIPALAADLGVSEDELAGLTLPQLNQKIEEIRQQEFSSADAAEAEALSAVGNRAKQLATERQALGQSGRMGYEQQFASLQEGIQNADQVEVGGQRMSIDKLLSDETISQLVSNAALTPSALAKLKETEPGLAQWVEQYKSALIDLSKEAGLVATDVADRQLEAEKLKENVSSDLFSTLFGKQPDIFSKEELDALKTQMAASPLWQKLNADVNFRSRLELSPEMAAQLQGLDATSLDTLMNATKAAEANPVLADLAGYTPGGLLTPAQADFVNTWRDEMQALPPAIASDKAFQDMLKSGQLTEATAMLLADDPSLWDAYKAEEQSAKQLSRVKNEDQFLEMLTGNPGFTVADFDDAMSSLKAWAATGDKKALDYYTKLSKAITGPDGKLDLADVQRALTEMSSSKQGLSGVIGGQEGLASMMKKLSATLQEGAVYSDNTDQTKKVALTYLKNDQRIDAQEMGDIIGRYGNQFAKQLLDSPWLPNKNELAQVYNEGVKAQAVPVITDMLRFVKEIPGMAGLHLNPDGTLPSQRDMFGNIVPVGFDSNAAKNMKKTDVAAYKQKLEQLRAAYRQEAQNLYNDPAYAEAEKVVDALLKAIDGTIAMQDFNAQPTYNIPGLESFRI